jgi:phthalate 4,5-dioxygenase oxygenase subunit
MNREDNEILSHTGPGTPLGELMRRYWIPALLSRELEADGAPIRVRLLGEDLVAWRDSAGRPGLFDEHCRHRGTSLYWGANAEGGLRCWYHGWKYDVDGNCLELPNDPNGERLKGKVKQKAYPCVERGGVVFTYMGPRERQPAFPEIEWANLPEGQVYVSKRLQDCYWLQGLEGDIDSSHIGFLHGVQTMQKATEYDMSEQTKLVSGDVHPKFEVVHKENGLLQGAKRSADAGSDYWRIGGWLLPCFTLLPGFPGDSPLGGHSWVPVDDNKVWAFGVNWHPKRKLTADELRQYHEGTPTGLHSTMTPGSFIAARNKSNGYADPESPPTKQPWQRVTIFQDQDTAVTESMGAQFDRTEEFLCGSDIVIVNVRRRLIAAARELAEGKEPPTDPKGFRLRGLSCVLPKDTPSFADAVAEALDARPETFTVSV